MYTGKILVGNTGEWGNIVVHHGSQFPPVENGLNPDPVGMWFIDVFFTAYHVACCCIWHMDVMYGLLSGNANSFVRGDLELSTWLEICFSRFFNLRPLGGHQMIHFFG